MVTLVFLLKGAFRPSRHDFPDDCDIAVGRAPAGDGVTVEGAGRRFTVRAPASSLSEHHATLRVRGGLVTVEDRASRNGTFVRLPAAAPRPLDDAPVWFGTELSLHLDGARWEVPSEFHPLTAEGLCAALRARLDGRGLVVTLGEGPGHAWHVEGDARPLVVRPANASRTAGGDDLAWARLTLNAYNTAVAARRAADPWRFTAVSPARARALDQCRRAAPTRLPVLLLGPTGAGKEVLAQGLHDHAPWARGPFVAVNCAELSPERLESQLFGHARGAFTGATDDRAGLVDAASGGTLFLDEVGETPPDVQARLLRFLESERGEYRRMGDPRPRYASVRVVAATHRDLADPASPFRRDLYFRLAGVVVEVPAPAPEDVTALTRELFAQRAGRLGAPEGEALEAIAADAAHRAWPGGVRALRQAVDRCLQMRDPARAWEENWRDACQGPRPSLPPPAPPGASTLQPAAVARALGDLLFLTAARETSRRGELARRLGMTYQGVDQRLQAMGLALDDRAAVERRLAECAAALRGLTERSPALAAALRGALGA